MFSACKLVVNIWKVNILHRGLQKCYLYNVGLFVIKIKVPHALVLFFFLLLYDSNFVLNVVCMPTYVNLCI